jgi:flavodoxin
MENKIDTLIVYFSWGGANREIAQEIQKLTGYETLEFVPVNSYDDDFDATIKRSEVEIGQGVELELEEFPQLSKQVCCFDRYFIGSPNWLGTLAPPVSSFLKAYDFSGKELIPFCSHGTGGIQNVAADIAKLAPEAEVKPYFETEGVRDKAPDWKARLNAWLESVGVL